MNDSKHPFKKAFWTGNKNNKKYINEHTAKVTDSYFEAENPNVTRNFS